MLEVDFFLIRNVRAREVLDSRGNPTLEAEVLTEGGVVGRASVPAGASKGVHEAVELRDGGKRFHGLGVLKAVRNVNEIIAKELKGMDVREQGKIDRKLIELDGTPNKSRLGANAVLGVSLAVAKAAATSYGIPLYAYLGGIRARTLPVPLMNIINGGKHAGNELKIQEFMIIPIGFKTFKEALTAACEIYYELKSFLKERYGLNAINVGDEGGFAPPMKESREALEALVSSIESTGYKPGSEVALGIDAAASNFYEEKKDKYIIDGKELSSGELADYYMELISSYPIRSIEDPFHEEDFKSFASFTRNVRGKVQVVGDDIFVTNVERLKRGIELGAANALLLKVNQIGTLTEALEAAELAFRSGYKVIVSHRSGETEDDYISDIAVGLNTGQIKTGAPARGERTVKYNRLIRIEEELGGRALYPGKEAFSF
ncbi:MAG: phosphopyruvate hydratase [Thermofilum sp. ex4484_15]|nr:MAG: phosphopyruvate hydratase [Thermofilum sp. ex4484_15]